MKRPGWSNSRVRSLRSFQNSSVIWKSLPWWHMASTKARSRAYSASRRALLVPIVSSDCPCMSAQNGRYSDSVTMRSGLLVASSDPASSRSVITRSPGAADSPSSRWLRSPVGQAKASGRPSTGALALRQKRPSNKMRRVAPAVIGPQRQRKRLANPAQCRQHGAPRGRSAGDDGYPRLIRQQRPVACGEDVRKDTELEAVLTKGLQPHSRRPAAAIAQPHGDDVPRRQEAASHRNGEGLAPGPHVEARIVGQLQPGSVGRRGRDVVRRRWIAELRRAHVRGEAVHDADGARVVHAEPAGGEGQLEGLEAAGLELSRHGRQ